MFRVGTSIIISLILMVLESFIVIKIKGLSSIQFESIQHFIVIWAMNFFLSFVILTEARNWFMNKYNSDTEIGTE